MNIIYYGELDPYSGVNQQSSTLPIIIEELKLLLLFYDVVIVPPENLFEHRLALPAFEAFAAFVRAGRLTTTTDRKVRRPTDLVDERVALYAEDRVHQPGRPVPKPRRGPVAQYRRTAIAEIRDRWHALLPSAWTLQRDVEAQVKGFAESLRARCLADSQGNSYPIALRALDRTLAANVPASRSAVLARIATQHGRVSPRDLAQAALAVQMTYFELGARTHRTLHSPVGPGHSCRIFPGRFAHLLSRRGLLPKSDVHSTYAWEATPEIVSTRWDRSGIPLKEWLSLESTAFSEVAMSSEWLTLRRSPDPREPLDQLRTILPSTPVRKERLVPSFRPTPIVLASEWQFAVQTTLGTLLPECVPKAGPTLDLRTLTIGVLPNGPTVSLHRHEVLLVALLIIAGGAGLTGRDAKQLLFDVDRFDADAERSPLLGFTPQAQESDELDFARLDRLNVLKHRTNEALAPLHIQVGPMDGRGVFNLLYTHGAPCTPQIEGTLWTLFEPSATLPNPPGLSALQFVLWTALANAAPHSMCLPALALIARKPCDARGLKQTADILRKLNHRLAAARIPVRVRRVRRGHYALLPLPTPLPTTSASVP